MRYPQQAFAATGLLLRSTAFWDISPFLGLGPVISVCLIFRRFLIELNVPVLAKCKANNSEHHQDGSGDHQPMRILHRGALLPMSSASFSLRSAPFRKYSIAFIESYQVSTVAASHAGFPSGHLTSSNEGTWVLFHHDSSAAPQTVQTASPVCGTKNFVSVRLYSAPQLHRTIVAILGICPRGTPDQPPMPLRSYSAWWRCAFGGSIQHQTTPSCWLQRTGPLAAGVLTHWRRNSRCNC